MSHKTVAIKIKTILGEPYYCGFSEGNLIVAKSIEGAKWFTEADTLKTATEILLDNKQSFELVDIDINDFQEKKHRVDKQIQETVKQELEGVTVRLATITCGCGKSRALLLMYKCLYCKEWFCHACAEEHFGKTVEQYRKENPSVSVEAGGL